MGGEFAGHDSLLYQTLTRNLPAAQNNNLFPWLQAQYRIWARIGVEASQASTRIGLAELVLSGCTTVFDPTYFYQNGNSVDCQIEAAREMGVRFHASRGSMSLGESQGGLPPDECVEDEKFILEDSERVIRTHHDASHGAMTRIVLAPCAPFSVTTSLLRDSAALARQYGVKLHTHLQPSEAPNRCLDLQFQHVATSLSPSPPVRSMWPAPPKTSGRTRRENSSPSGMPSPSINSIMRIPSAESPSPLPPANTSAG